MDENYVEQPDGRKVAGPQPRGPGTDSSKHISYMLIPTIIVVLTFVAFGLGYLTAPPKDGPSLRALQGAMVEKGCIPAILVGGLGATHEEAQKVADALAVEKATSYGDAKNIEVAVLPAGKAIQDHYPGMKYLAVVYLDRCLPGA